MGIDVLISAFVANTITGLVKPSKNLALTAKEKAARATLIRIINAFFALVMLVVSSLVMGEDLKPESVMDAVSGLVTLFTTFLVGQGGYALLKSFFKKSE